MKRSLWLDRNNALPQLPFLALCASEAQFLRVHNGMKAQNPPPGWLNPGANATTHHYDTPEGKTAIVVCVDARHAGDYERLAALLAHEAVHVWQHYRDHVLREAKPCAETEAYVIQSILQKLLYAYRAVRRG